MAISKARKDANYNFEKKNYDRILVRFPAGMKEKIEEEASGSGQSVNNYIVNVTCDSIGVDRPLLKELKTLKGKEREDEA